MAQTTTEMEDEQGSDLTADKQLEERQRIRSCEGRQKHPSDFLPTDDDINYDSPDHVVITVQDFERDAGAGIIESQTKKIVEGTCHNCGCNRLEAFSTEPAGVAGIACVACNASTISRQSDTKLEVNSRE